VEQVLADHPSHPAARQLKIYLLEKMSRFVEASELKHAVSEDSARKDAEPEQTGEPARKASGARSGMREGPSSGRDETAREEPGSSSEPGEEQFAPGETPGRESRSPEEKRSGLSEEKEPRNTAEISVIIITSVYVQGALEHCLLSVSVHCVLSDIR